MPTICTDAMLNGIQYEPRIITPDEAKRICVENRIMHSMFKGRSVDMISDYGSDMVSGNWKLNGDAIIFDSDGKLIDGRKRLLACITRNAPFLTFVITGIDPAAAGQINRQQRRTDEQILQISGCDDAKTLTKFITTIVAIAQTGLPSQKLLRRGAHAHILEDEPEIATIPAAAVLLPVAGYFAPSDITALLYLTRRIDPDQSARFFADLDVAIGSTGRRGTDPISRLAEGLLSVQRSIDNDGAKQGNSKTRYMVVSYTIRAWNAWRTKTPLPKLVDVPKPQKRSAPRLDGLPEDLYEFHTRRPTERAASVDALYDADPKALAEGVVMSVEIIHPLEAIDDIKHRNGPLHRGLGRNRKLSKLERATYARDMTTARWLLTGQSIKYSWDGRLIDGQHRLSACGQSNVPLLTFVVRGLDPDVFDTFDVAPQHTLSQMLDMEGKANSTVLQDALTYLWHSRETGLGSVGKHKPSIAELRELEDEYPDLQMHVDQARDQKFDKYRLPAAHLATIMTILHEFDFDKAQDFFDKIALGGMRDASHPVLQARRTLTGLVANKEHTVDPWPRIHLLCRAWNAFAEDRKAKLPKNPKEVLSLKAVAPFDRGSSPTIKHVGSKADQPLIPGLEAA